MTQAQIDDLRKACAIGNARNERLQKRLKARQGKQALAFFSFLFLAAVVVGSLLDTTLP
jgi:hypothetical protein